MAVGEGGGGREVAKKEGLQEITEAEEPSLSTYSLFAYTNFCFMLSTAFSNCSVAMFFSSSF